MNNLKTYTDNSKFMKLYGNNDQAILMLDKCLEEQGYVFNGNWREDVSSGGYNSSFELIREIGGRKNLITLRPMKRYLKVEVYWGYSKKVHEEMNKKPKKFYEITIDNGIPGELIDEIRELYNFLAQ